MRDIAELFFDGEKTNNYFPLEFTCHYFDSKYNHIVLNFSRIDGLINKPSKFIDLYTSVNSKISLNTFKTDLVIYSDKVAATKLSHGHTHIFQ